MQKYPVTTLREELTFTNDLMLDENFNLLPAGCPVTNELTAALREWDIKDRLQDVIRNINLNL